MKAFNKLISWRKSRIAKEILALYGVEIPSTVVIGTDFRLLHRGFGTVIHPTTVIGDRVTVYHQVTIGRKDAYRPPSGNGHAIIGDDVVLCPGAKILFGSEPLVIAEGTIVGANAVLMQATGPYEVWAGIPARCIGKRDDRVAKS